MDPHRPFYHNNSSGNNYDNSYRARNYRDEYTNSNSAWDRYPPQSSNWDRSAPDSSNWDRPPNNWDRQPSSNWDKYPASSNWDRTAEQPTGNWDKYPVGSSSNWDKYPQQSTWEKYPASSSSSGYWDRAPPASSSNWDKYPPAANWDDRYRENYRDVRDPYFNRNDYPPAGRTNDYESNAYQPNYDQAKSSVGSYHPAHDGRPYEGNRWNPVRQESGFPRWGGQQLDGFRDYKKKPAFFSWKKDKNILSPVKKKPIETKKEGVTKQKPKKEKGPDDAVSTNLLNDLNSKSHEGKNESKDENNIEDKNGANDDDDDFEQIEGDEDDVVDHFRDPALESMVRLSLSMLEYRISISLLSLNLSPGILPENLNPNLPPNAPPVIEQKTVSQPVTVVKEANDTKDLPTTTPIPLKRTISNVSTDETAKKKAKNSESKPPEITKPIVLEKKLSTDIQTPAKTPVDRQSFKSVEKPSPAPISSTPTTSNSVNATAKSTDKKPPIAPASLKPVQQPQQSVASTLSSAPSVPVGKAGNQKTPTAAHSNPPISSSSADPRNLSSSKKPINNMSRTPSVDPETKKLDELATKGKTPQPAPLSTTQSDGLESGEIGPLKSSRYDRKPGTLQTPTSYNSNLPPSSGAYGSNYYPDHLNRSASSEWRDDRRYDTGAGDPRYDSRDARDPRYDPRDARYDPRFDRSVDNRYDARSRTPSDPNYNYPLPAGGNDPYPYRGSRDDYYPPNNQSAGYYNNTNYHGSDPSWNGEMRDGRRDYFPSSNWDNPSNNNYYPPPLGGNNSNPNNNNWSEYDRSLPRSGSKHEYPNNPSGPPPRSYSNSSRDYYDQSPPPYDQRRNNNYYP